jgi:RNA methyltransferase, TrmH family
MLPFKKDIRFVKSLHLKKFRMQEKLFIVEGRKMVIEAIAGGHEVHSIYTTDEDLASKHDRAFMVNAREMDQLSSFSSPSPYLAVLSQRSPKEETPSGNDVLVLDGISDPGNFGTIMRTAEWFGISQLICTGDCVEMYNPKVVQASMGSILRMQALYLREEQIIESLHATGYEMIGAALGGTALFDYSFPKKTAVVIGSESHGIRPLLRNAIKVFLEIPGSGHAESLNASVASGIFLAELFRNRR